MNAPTPLDGPRLPAASGTATRLVILLHGYGANGEDLFGLAQPLSTILPEADFVSPNAPQRNPFGAGAFQWFPIPRIDGSSEADMRSGMVAATEILDGFITNELARRGLPPEACALLGFSQGTMMALHVGLRRAESLAGIVGFSGRLMDPERLPGEIRSKPPVLLVHGDMDDVVPFSEMAAAEAGLQAAGVSVATHRSPGVAHGIAPDGLQLAAGFLKARLA